MAKLYLSELHLYRCLTRWANWLEPVGWLNWSSFAVGRGLGVTPGLTCSLDLADFCSDLEPAVLVPPAALLLSAK